MKFRRVMEKMVGLALAAACLSIPMQAADAPRNFVVVFEIRSYTGDVGEAVRFIFSDLLRSGDQLIVFTPGKVYGFSKATLARPPMELTAMLQDKLCADAAQSQAGFSHIVKDMKKAVEVIEDVALGDTNYEESGSGGMGSQQHVDSPLKQQLMTYRQLISNLFQVRRVNDRFLGQTIGVFRNQPGRNHLIVIYEHELRPIPSKRAMDVLREDPKISFQVQELFAQQSTRPPFDAAAVSMLCSQVPVTAHFLYFRPKSEASLGADFFDNSGDLYDAFSQVAEASGGVREAISEVKAGLKSVIAALKASASEG